MVSEKIDEGSIIDYETNLFTKCHKTPIEFKLKYLNDFKKFYKAFISKIKSGYKFELLSQTNYLSNYYPRLNSKTDAWVDWSLEPNQLENFINAFDDPYSGAITKINNKIVKIKKIQLHGGEVIPHKYMTGLIVRNDKKWIVVCTAGNSYLIIEEVLDSQKKI